ncbi:MAG: thiamine phosphate synthase [Candidatus Acidiferrales bacterium]
MRHPFPALYAILDVTGSGEQHVFLSGELADAGVRLVQLRGKHLSSRFIYERSRSLIERLDARGVRVIVNDRPDIALLAGAGGVHVGQDDLPVEDARKICSASLWVGVSTHSLEQLRAAARTSADYIAVGPVFPTCTKENPDPVVGVELVRAARALTQKPLVAIGGITVESAEQIFRAGADSVAVVRDLSGASDPGQRAREYLSIAERVFATRN